MKVWEELELVGIDRCPECWCVVSTDWEYRDFSNKTIAVCPQCDNLIYLDNSELDPKGDKEVG